MKPSLSKKETAIFSYRFLENEYEPLNNIHETWRSEKNWNSMINLPLVHYMFIKQFIWEAPDSQLRFIIEGVGWSSITKRWPFSDSLVSCGPKQRRREEEERAYE